jgi:hypothetical protein
MNGKEPEATSVSKIVPSEARHDRAGHDGDAERRVTVFASQATGRRQGFVGETIGFLINNKKWWLGPIVIVLLVMSFLVILSATSIAPFIYTLF